MARADNDNPARSLSVMTDRKTNGISKVTKFRVDPLLIQVEPGFNCRTINPDHVAQFETSILAGHYIPEMVVRVAPGIERGRESIILVDGEHRLTAYVNLIRKGKIENAMVEVTQFTGNDADRIILMLGTANGLPVTTLQRARQYHKLTRLGWDKNKIAEQFGRTVTHVNQLLEMAALPQIMQNRIEAGEIKSHQAIKMFKKHGENTVQAMDEAMEAARLRGKSNITPKDSDGATPQDFIKAIKVEMDSGGTFKVEDICPTYAHLAQYLRNSHQVAKMQETAKAIAEINGVPVGEKQSWPDKQEAAQ